MTRPKGKWSGEVAREDERKQSEANETKTYGPLLDAVRFLRSKGWVVFRERNEFRVGTMLKGEAGLLEIYNREKRREADVLAAKRTEGKEPTGLGKGRRRVRGKARSRGGRGNQQST